VTPEPASIRRVTIRPFRPADLDALYRVCLQTGRNGGDATPLYHDHKLLGHVHAAPYALFEPSLAFVAEDAAGVGGYVIGALDSRDFEARLERDWWPKLRAVPCRPPHQRAHDRVLPPRRLHSTPRSRRCRLRHGPARL